MLEICVAADSPHLTHNLLAAKHGGAHRVELCRAMDKDGLTPTADSIKCARRVLGKEVLLLVMIRNHADHFHVSAQQRTQMLKQIDTAAECGADGVVAAALGENGTIDVDCTHHLTARAHHHGLSLTFHRAFDAVSNASIAARQLAELGVARILSAGQTWGSTGPEDARLQRLTQLADTFPKHLELVVGGGVSADTLPVFSALAHCYPRLSFHSFSAVLKNGQVCTDKVRTLSQYIHSFSQRAD
ncbi:copper homeostasis protein CutC [Alteromonas halophila]|uniref:Copper homeostasis protein cutC homolog n=1 Tax=Alteromonas halophila TaxID=516698 RepID=A0A918JK49_9ALTE|nr:copper homeostasis protein CutC [Alteromonas halophila]GGW84787.1 hypothetical protein GCM10007391_18190 [Alteromonas halophila]